MIPKKIQNTHGETFHQREMRWVKNKKSVRRNKSTIIQEARVLRKSQRGFQKNLKRETIRPPIKKAITKFFFQEYLHQNKRESLWME